MTRSRTPGAELVQPAQIVQHEADGLGAPEIAARIDLCDATVRFLLKRFNERGLAGLEEDMRSGRPPTYSAEERSAVITAALRRPSTAGSRLAGGGHAPRPDGAQGLAGLGHQRCPVPVVADILPLAQAEAAHQRFRTSGVQGKMLLRVADRP